MQKKDDPGMFRQLDEIIYVSGYPGYQYLSSIAEKSMQIVCDFKGNLNMLLLLKIILDYSSRSPESLIFLTIRY